MNRALNILLAAAAVVVPISVLQAKPIGESDVTSGKVRMDPTMGYILISGPVRQFGVYLRIPDNETRSSYEEDRRKAFAKAQKRYPGELATWQSSVDIAKQTGSAPPERPEEPKLETFSIDSIELRDVESFGPMFAYAKGERLSYLNVVKPGTFIWYGPVLMAAGSASGGVCYCMGSVRFEVKPAVVTDLGSSLADLPRWQDDTDVARLDMRERSAKRVAAGQEPLKMVESAEPKYGLPASLAAWPSARAELHANAKINNYYGVLVSRLAPIPAVLAYHRDVAVDLKTGQELPSPTLVSRAKVKK